MTEKERGFKTYATDVYEDMVECLKKKASKQKFENISLIGYNIYSLMGEGSARGGVEFQSPQNHAE